MKYFYQNDKKYNEMTIDGKDKALLALLRTNARQSTTLLARELGVSRATVVSRIERLEKRGIIKGYTIRFDEHFERGQVRAHVMIHSQAKASSHIVQQLKKLPAISALHAVNGSYEMVAMVETESTESLDHVLDTIGSIEGVIKTNTSIILSTKFVR